MPNPTCNLFFFNEEDADGILTTVLKVKKAICDRQPVRGFTYVHGLIGVPYSTALEVIESVDEDFANHPNAAILVGGEIKDVFLCNEVKP